MPLNYDPKDPNDIDDFSVGWAPQLASGETLAAAAATVLAGGVTVSSSSIDGSDAIHRITGGTDGSTARVRSQVTTSAGRVLNVTLVFQVRSN